MDYMNWYEKCLVLARIKANGGETSEFERSELEKSSEYCRDNNNNIYVGNVGVLPV